MAATVVAVGTAVSGSTGPVTVSWPTPHQIEDTLVVFGECQDNFFTINQPNGIIFHNGTNVGTTTSRLYVWRVRAWCASMPDILFDSPGNHHLYVPVLMRGTLQTQDNTLHAGSTFGTKVTPSTSVSINGFTPTELDTLYFAAVSRETAGTSPVFSGWTNSTITGLTEIADVGTNAGGGGGIGIATGVNPALTAIGTTTATSDLSANVWLTWVWKGAVTTGAVYNNYVASPRWRGSRTTVNLTSSTSQSLNLPDNYVKNDLLVAAVSWNGSTQVISMAGWTAIAGTQAT